ncbi:MAG: cysteine desulfurase family protein [Nanoarchaeota archaeon]|nr:cysteine desulfurase family protein [Nanoarchaeota archaeon]
MKQFYFDNAATTKVDEEVLKAMQPYFIEKYGNASSLHYPGEESRRAIEEARNTIAKSIGAKHKELIFTGSGTESNNLVIKGLFWENYPKKNHIITTKIEHDCVLNACKWIETRGGKVTYLNVNGEGFVNLDELRNSITEKTILVSVIHGNNEIGTIQDLEKIGKICKEKNVLFHTDACQSFTKTEIDVKKMNLDLVTLNAHKIHGPKGVGALYVKEGIKIIPLLHGGGQEFKLRSSTENVPGIVGFEKAVKIAKESNVKKMEKLRDRLIKGISEIPNTTLNGSCGEKRLCSNINVSFNNVEGEAIGSFLNAKGISCSTGSACSSRSQDPSHVLLALGKTPAEANTSVRLSISKYTTEEEIDYVLEELKKIVERLRKISHL